MNYTPIVLFSFGLMGVLLHNLVKLNDLNKSTNGNIDLLKYFKMEVFSILISIVVVGACVVAAHEIKQLEQVGKWLGLGFVSIGYMGQSLLIKWVGKAEKIVGDLDEKK